LALYGIQDHTPKEYNTNIKKVDVLMIEKKLRENPMISIPAL